MNVNYLQTTPDSHFWTNIEMLLNWIKTQKVINHSKNDILNYLELGLTNTLKNGFDIEEKCKDPVVEAVRQKLKERSNVGVKKYGTTLEDNNTDNFYKHALEESLDMNNYLMKIIKNEQK